MKEKLRRAHLAFLEHMRRGRNISPGDRSPPGHAGLKAATNDNTPARDDADFFRNHFRRVVIGGHDALARCDEALSLAPETKA